MRFLLIFIAVLLANTIGAFAAVTELPEKASECRQLYVDKVDQKGCRQLVKEREKAERKAEKAQKKAKRDAERARKKEEKIRRKAKRKAAAQAARNTKSLVIKTETSKMHKHFKALSLIESYIGNKNKSETHKFTIKQHQTAVDELFRFQDLMDNRAKKIFDISNNSEKFSQHNIKIDYHNASKLSKKYIIDLQKNIDLRNQQISIIFRNIELFSYQKRKFDRFSNGRLERINLEKIQNIRMNSQNIANKIYQVYGSKIDKSSANTETLSGNYEAFLDIYLNNKNLLGDPDASRLAFRPLHEHFNDDANRALKALEDMIAENCEDRFGSECTMLAKFLESGENGRQDHQRAASLHESGCQHGSALACENAGLLYTSGKGVSKSLRRATSLFEQSCDLSGAEDCFRFGNLFEEEYDKESPKHALSFYEKGCDREHGPSCERAGLIHLEGNGILKDPTQAVSLLETSCEHEQGSACRKLGQVYETGEDVAKNSKRAGHFFNLACKLGNEPSCIDLHTARCDEGTASSCHKLAEIYAAKPFGDSGYHLKASELYNKACKKGLKKSCVSAETHKENTNKKVEAVERIVSFNSCLKNCENSYGESRLSGLIDQCSRLSQPPIGYDSPNTSNFGFFNPFDILTGNLDVYDVNPYINTWQDEAHMCRIQLQQQRKLLQHNKLSCLASCNSNFESIAK